MEPADRRAPNNKWQSSPAGHSFSERDIENVAMWCWTLFLARMITRVGLLLAASLWAACPWASSGMTYAFGPSKARQVYIAFEDSYLSAACIQQVAYSVGVDWRPQVDVPGLMVWDAGPPDRGVLIHYWLICLMFLVATVATSWRRKKSVVDTQKPGADSATEAEHGRTE